MKYFFIVQGEGMGHITQSLALRSILEKNGHTITTTLIGRNFFRRENVMYRSVKHENFYSPVFLSRGDNTGINLFSTFLYNLLLVPLYIFTILRIAYQIRTSEANAVIVFYDMIGQSGSFFSFTGKPVYSISHHFFFGHPVFKWPSSRKTEQMMLRLHSWLASLGARKKLALSFTNEMNIPGKNLFVVPPLLRPEILVSDSIPGEHIHIYCLQAGYLYSVLNLARRNPQKKFRVFLHEEKTHYELPDNVHVSALSEKIFVESIRTCGLVITTAGFETLAEAIYLNKSLFIVPSENHYEQYCNSVDALRAKAAIAGDSFKIDSLPVFSGNPAHDEFIRWVSLSEEIMMKHITE